MITKIQGYKSSDGKMHTSIEDAQKAELTEIFRTLDLDNNEESMWKRNEMIDAIFQNRDKIIDILTTTPSSKPKARAINGGRKKRAARNEQTTMFQTATPAAPAA